MLLLRLVLGRVFLAALVCGAIFRVSAAPVLVADVADVVVPNGSVNGTPATFSVSATGVGTVSYQWFRVEDYFNGSRKYLGSSTNALAGQTSAQATVTEWQGVFTRTSSTYYSFMVKVTDETGTINSRSASVSVAPPNFAPSIYSDLLPTYGANEGQPLTLAVGVGAYPLNVFWYHNDALVPELTNISFTFPAAALEHEGRWWMVCSNALGMVTSRVAQVSIIPAIQFNTAQLGAVTIDLDHLVVTNWNSPGLSDLNGRALTLAITGGQAPFVTSGTWMLNLNANGSYTVAAGVMPAASGQWSRRVEMAGVVALDLTGFYADATTATLSLVENRYFELSKQGVVANQHGNWSLAGFEPTYTTNAPTATFSLVASTTGNFTLSYQWFKDGIALPGKTSTTLAIDPATSADNGAYTCVVTRSDGKTRTSPAGSLTVLGGGDQEVVYEFAAGTISFSWPAGAHLETKATLDGPWTKVVAESPATFPTEGSAAFFRWVKP
jgi:hypothetical protein